MNKFLITIIVPNIEYECDLFIPNNKKVGTIKSSILESLKTLTNGVFNKTINDVKFIDKDLKEEYDNDKLIKDTKIKNGTKLIIL
ncbi:MAG: hypothetical protein MR938_03425 [Tenericutes bacterium]|nr:hypothetical protein [Mycoplasmatota bacterium]